MTVRIASLVPSLTELLFALGLGPWVVARTGYCTQPADAVAAVPKVGGTKDVNLGKLRRLAPTHVFVNIDENRLETAEALRSFVPQVIVTHPCGPEDVDGLISQMATVFAGLPGVAERAELLRAELQAELAATQTHAAVPVVSDRAAALRAELRDELAATTARADVPVLYLIWRAPWMSVARDTYISRLLGCVGWRTRPATRGGEHGAARYPTLQGDEAWLAGVREVLLSSEPYAFSAEHVAHAQTLCPQARVRLVDGALLSWYGPRTAAGLRYLRELSST
jgi:ABC-type Fe3+-hydroxamate transport system substrate-binding protein